MKREKKKKVCVGGIKSRLRKRPEKEIKESNEWCSGE